MIWALVTLTGWANPRLLPSPVVVVHAFIGLVADGTLGEYVLASLGRVAAGLAIGGTIGVILALVTGLSRWGAAVVDGPMQMFRAMPVTATVPLFIVWFGIGEEPKIALIAVACAFPIYLNLLGGIQGVDAKLLEIAQVLRLGRLETIRHIILPGALPSFLVGLRYALGIAWVLLVIAEQLNATSGLGYMMNEAATNFRTDIIFVGLLIYSLLGLICDAFVRFLEAKTLAWRPTLRGAR